MRQSLTLKVLVAVSLTAATAGFAAADDALSGPYQSLEAQVQQEKAQRKQDAIADLNFLRTAIKSYLGESQDLDRYIVYQGFPITSGDVLVREKYFWLTKDDVVIPITDDLAYARVAQRLPFLEGAANGQLTLTHGAETRAQFEKLKTEMHASLRALSSLDSACNELWDLGYFSLATMVLSDQKDSKGAWQAAPVITYAQFQNLDLQLKSRTK